MKIEIRKDTVFTKEDMNYLISNQDLIIDSISFKGKVYNVFDSLDLNKIDELSFYKLSHIACNMIKKTSNEVLFDKCLSLIYFLINKEEEKFILNTEKPLSDLYYLLGILSYGESINFIHWSDKNDIFNLEKDTRLAIEYFNKSLLLNPCDSVFSVLGKHYFLQKNYQRAYSYLKYVSDIYDSFNVYEEIYMWSEIGNYFDSIRDEDIFYDDIIFNSFNNAYKLSKLNNDSNEYLEMVLYNMAYVYINGIGVKTNIDKGIEYLSKIDELLKDKKIEDIEDPDDIVKYYLSNK